MTEETGRYVPQFQFRLLVVGEPLDSDWVSSLVGLAATSTTLRGQPVGSGGMTARHSSWVHSWAPFEAWSVREALEPVVVGLAERSTAFVTLRRAELTVELRIVGVLRREEPPDLGLTSTTIEALALIGAQLDVDLYWQGERDLLARASD